MFHSIGICNEAMRNQSHLAAEWGFVEHLNVVTYRRHTGAMLETCLDSNCVLCTSSLPMCINCCKPKFVCPIELHTT
jgi:hypothetical protein